MQPQKPFVIGNWKMKLGVPESIALAKEIKRGATAKADIVVCPSFVSLTEVASILKRSNVKLGAQDCFWEAQGAYTGEVSGESLYQAGCRFVILGHSERRAHLGETNEIINRKVRAALAAGLTPIVCIGETFEQRQEGAQDYALVEQTTKILQGITPGSAQQVLVTHEPVWGISGTGLTVEPHQIELAQQIIHQTLLDMFPARIVERNFRIIYGGNVNSTNIESFRNLSLNSGFLVGSASLSADKFFAIVSHL